MFAAELAEETDDYHQMDEYSNLLKQGISHHARVQKGRRKGTSQSIQIRRHNRTSVIKIKGIEDFKLVSFLIVR